MKTKKIKSNKEKALIKLDIAVIFFCLIRVRMNMEESFLETIVNYIKIYKYDFFACLIIIIYILFMYIIMITIKNFIIIAIYLAYRNSRMKVIKENCKYEVIDNIEYYRERFNNITPAEISLITDLEIETKKDITASILGLYQKEIIDFSENNIIVKNEEKVLRQSEKELINMLKSNNFDTHNIEKWKSYCIKEATENNYIREKAYKEKKVDFSKNNMVTKIFAKIFIISFILMSVLLFSPYGRKMYDRSNEFESKYRENGKSDLEIIENNQEAKDLYIEFFTDYCLLWVIATTFGISLFVLIGTPIYRKVRRKIYNKIEINNIYERTKESKILVEQIAGIKNYIHDFSLLSEKDKENIILWEDFLIYAVVLEENEAIINDICDYKNINLNNYSNIKNLLIAK